MKKKNIILLAIIICVVLVICIIFYLKSNNNLNNNSNNEKNNTNNNNSITEKVVYKFKKFEFKEVSGSNITFEDYSDNDYGDDSFKINGDTWYALVRIYVDDNNNIVKYPEIYKKFFEKYEIDVDDPVFYNVGDTKVVTFNNNTLRCVVANFTLDNHYGFEASIYSSDFNFNPDTLQDLVKTLKNVSIDKNDTGSDEDNYRVINSAQFPSN